MVVVFHTRDLGACEKGWRLLIGIILLLEVVEERLPLMIHLARNLLVKVHTARTLGRRRYLIHFIWTH